MLWSARTKEINRLYDEYGPIAISEKGQYRILTFGTNEEQSCQLLSDPTFLVHEYNRLMVLAMLFTPVQHATLLGLGAGTIAQCLHKRLQVPVVQSVELRNMVLSAARKYFDFPRNPELPVFIGDAWEYISQAQAESTDVIFVDVFSAEGLELSLYTPDFYADCHFHLTDKGWLVLNCWLDSGLDRRLLKQLKKLFVDIRVAITPEGNWIVFAGKQQGPELGKSLERSAKVLGKRLGFSLMPLLKKVSMANI